MGEQTPTLRGMTIGVLVVEDDANFRRGFAQAIVDAPQLQMLGLAENLAQGQQLLRELRPDVLLVDLGLPDGSGIGLIMQASQDLPDCDVLVITMFGDDHHVLASIEAGATGYLLKDSSAPDIAEQIRVLRAGGSPISPVIARQLLSRFARGALAQQIEPIQALGTRLSDQECLVLRYSAKGYSYEELAALMQISRHTVMTYVKRIYRKLQVHSKTEAVYEARRLGIMGD